MLYSWNVIGHEKQLRRLEEDLASGNIHHAYLLVGPEKIGKFRVAKALAGILQCPNNFCRSCQTCIQIEKKYHPDTIELPDDGESVKINTVRDIIARLNMTGQSKHKILLIENIGRLTDEASSCLLKILEEPPQNTIFLFTADQLRDIMPTIASRMRIIHFKKLPDEVLRVALRERHPECDDETIDQALLLSLGRSGKAIKLLSQPEMLAEQRDLYRLIQFLESKASPATRMAEMLLLSQDPEKTKLFLALLVHHLRRSLMQTLPENSTSHTIRMLEEIHRVIDLLGRNVNPRLLLENLMLQL